MSLSKYDKYGGIGPAREAAILEDLEAAVTQNNASSGSLYVDITLTDAKMKGLIVQQGVKARSTIAMNSQPTVGNTFTLGTKVYTFSTDLQSVPDGLVYIGAELWQTQENIKSVINNDAASPYTALTWTDSMIIEAKAFGVNTTAFSTTEPHITIANMGATLAGASYAFDDIDVLPAPGVGTSYVCVGMYSAANIVATYDDPSGTLNFGYANDMGHADSTDIGNIIRQRVGNIFHYEEPIGVLHPQDNQPMIIRNTSAHYTGGHVDNRVFYRFYYIIVPTVF